MSEREIESLRTDVATLSGRIDEFEVTQRQTQQAVSRLAESLAQLVSHQRLGERRLHLNSFFAYLLFTVLLGGGFFALYSTRAGAVVRERDSSARQRELAQVEVDRLRADADRRRAATAAAFEYYQLLHSADSREGRIEVIARYAQIDQESLTPTERELFASSVDRARGEIVDAGYLTGVDAFRRNQYDEAEAELRRAMAYAEEGARAAQIRYFLGVSLHRQGSDKEAVRQLELAIAGRVDEVGIEDARFYLATALERLGQLAEARAEFEKFASNYPRNALAIAARRAATRLSRSAAPRN